VDSEAIVGTTEGDVGFGVNLEFNVEDEGFGLKEDKGIGADGFEREFGGLEFGERDGLTQKPSSDVRSELFGNEFAEGVVGHLRCLVKERA
jgi:hypothetical protein